MYSLSNVKSVCMWVEAELWWWGSPECAGGWGSSPKLAEGPALVIVVRFRVGLPAFPLWRFVVNIGRRARVLIIWILLHHLEFGLNGTDLSTRTGRRGKEDRERCEGGNTRYWGWGWLTEWWLWLKGKSRRGFGTFTIRRGKKSEITSYSAWKTENNLYLNSWRSKWEK